MVAERRGIIPYHSDEGWGGRPRWDQYHRAKWIDTSICRKEGKIDWAGSERVL